MLCHLWISLVSNLVTFLSFHQILERLSYINLWYSCSGNCITLQYRCLKYWSCFSDTVDKQVINNFGENKQLWRMLLHHWICFALKPRVLKSSNVLLLRRKRYTASRFFGLSSNCTSLEFKPSYKYRAHLWSREMPCRDIQRTSVISRDLQLRMYTITHFGMTNVKSVSSYQQKQKKYFLKIIQFNDISAWANSTALFARNNMSCYCAVKLYGVLFLLART